MLKQYPMKLHPCILLLKKFVSMTRKKDIQIVNEKLYRKQIKAKYQNLNWVALIKLSQSISPRLKLYSILQTCHKTQIRVARILLSQLTNLDPEEEVL